MLLVARGISVLFLVGLGIVLVAGLVALWLFNPVWVIPVAVLAFFSFRDTRRQREEDQWQLEDRGPSNIGLDR